MSRVWLLILVLALGSIVVVAEPSYGEPVEHYVVPASAIDDYAGLPGKTYNPLPVSASQWVGSVKGGFSVPWDGTGEWCPKYDSAKSFVEWRFRGVAMWFGPCADKSETDAVLAKLTALRTRLTEAHPEFAGAIVHLLTFPPGQCLQQWIDKDGDVILSRVQEAVEQNLGKLNELAGDLDSVQKEFAGDGKYGVFSGPFSDTQTEPGKTHSPDANPPSAGEAEADAARSGAASQKVGSTTNGALSDAGASNALLGQLDGLRLENNGKFPSDRDSAAKPGAPAGPDVKGNPAGRKGSGDSQGEDDKTSGSGGPGSGGPLPFPVKSPFSAWMGSAFKMLLEYFQIKDLVLNSLMLAFILLPDFFADICSALSNVLYYMSLDSLTPKQLDDVLNHIAAVYEFLDRYAGYLRGFQGLMNDPSLMNLSKWLVSPENLKQWMAKIPGIPDFVKRELGCLGGAISGEKGKFTECLQARAREEIVKQAGRLPFGQKCVEAALAGGWNAGSAADAAECLGKDAAMHFVPAKYREGAQQLLSGDPKGAARTLVAGEVDRRTDGRFSTSSILKSLAANKPAEALETVVRDATKLLPPRYQRLAEAVLDPNTPNQIRAIVEAGSDLSPEVLKEAITDGLTAGASVLLREKYGVEITGAELQATLDGDGLRRAPEALAKLREQVAKIRGLSLDRITTEDIQNYLNSIGQSVIERSAGYLSMPANTSLWNVPQRLRARAKMMGEIVPRLDLRSAGDYLRTAGADFGASVGNLAQQMGGLVKGLSPTDAASMIARRYSVDVAGARSIVESLSAGKSDGAWKALASARTHRLSSPLREVAEAWLTSGPHAALEVARASGTAGSSGEFEDLAQLAEVIAAATTGKGTTDAWWGLVDPSLSDQTQADLDRVLDQASGIRNFAKRVRTEQGLRDLAAEILTEAVIAADSTSSAPGDTTAQAAARAIVRGDAKRAGDLLLERTVTDLGFKTEESRSLFRSGDLDGAIRHELKTRHSRDAASLAHEARARLAVRMAAGRMVQGRLQTALHPDSLFAKIALKQFSPAR